MCSFLQVTLHFSSHHTCHISTHFLLFDFYHPSNVWSYLPSRNPLIMQFSIIFYHCLILDPSNFLSAVFLKTLILCSSLNFRGSVYTGIKQEDALHYSFCNSISQDIRQTSYINFTLLNHSKVRVSTALDEPANVCNSTKPLMSL